MNNRDTIKHHYFDANGLNAKRRSMDSTINQYVDAGIIPSGWVIAYGTLNGFCGDNLYKLVGKRRVNTIKMRVALSMLEESIDKGYTKLGEFILSDEVWSKS